MNIFRYEPFFDKTLFSYRGEIYVTDEKIDPSLSVNYVTHKDNPSNGLSAPTRLQIQYTNRCNLQCEHCYVSSGKALPNELSDEMIHEILLQASQMGILQIEWSGGEPFSRKGLMDMVKVAGQYGFEQKLLTNGVAIGKSICDYKKLWRFFCEIQISIDNIGDQFNSFVGKNHWCDVDEAVQQLLIHKPKNRRLSLTTTLDQKNIEYLPVIYQYVSQKNVSWKIARQVRNGRSVVAEEQNDELLFESWRMLQSLRGQKSKAKILHPFDKTFGLKSIWPIEWQTEPGARWFMYVSASGDSYPSPYFDGVEEFNGGNVTVDTLEQIWRSKAFDKYRGVTRKKTKCADCSLICQMWSRPFSYFKRRDLFENPIPHPNCSLH